MSLSVWEGKLVRLREIEPEDWRVYAAWNQDDEQARSLEMIPLPQSDARVKAWAEQESTKERVGDNMRMAIVALDSGEVVGDFTVHHCYPVDGYFSYGISIRGDQRRKGYAREAIWLVLRYYFFERRYQKVNVGVYEFNEASIALHLKLGFQQEGRLRRTRFTNGRHWDELLFGMTIEEFRELFP